MTSFEKFQASKIGSGFFSPKKMDPCGSTSKFGILSSNLKNKK